MSTEKLRDAEAKKILLGWPGRTKLWPPPAATGYWLRGQPQNGKAAGPKLSAPGAKLFRTQPDGLWVHFRDQHCDAVVLEVCGSVQNLNDKRSRYIPASHSIVLDCSVAWMREEITVQKSGKVPRWKAAVSLAQEPVGDLLLPVRHLRVLYALPNKIYKQWIPEHTPTGYEFFCAHSSLGSFTSGKMQTFLRQMSMVSHFYT